MVSTEGSINAATATACPLCAAAGGKLIWQDALCRVVQVDDAEGRAFPGFCRVVWARHVGEMSDLPAPERRHFLSVIMAAEAAVRQVAKPDKMNLASLGNAVPHLHWHVIPRWRDDSHFPAAIWATPRRESAGHRRVSEAELRAALIEALGEEHGGGLA